LSPSKHPPLPLIHLVVQLNYPEEDLVRFYLLKTSTTIVLDLESGCKGCDAPALKCLVVDEEKVIRKG